MKRTASGGWRSAVRPDNIHAGAAPAAPFQETHDPEAFPFFSLSAVVWAACSKKRDHPEAGPRALSDRGLLAFSHTGDAIRAERLLRQQGFDVEVKGPPPQMRTGCDMVVVFPLIRQAAVLAGLKAAGLEPEQVVSAHDVLLEPVSLFQTSRLEHWLMVRAANMKITVDCRDRRIVNISGGGCPDVPWLAHCLCGKTLDTAPNR